MSERRRAAAQLCEELLADLELSRLPAPALVKKTSRLARFLDDWEALEWLAFEVSGYGESSTGKLTSTAVKAARRAGREFFNEKLKQTQYWPQSIGSLQTRVDAARAHLAASADAPVSISSANPYQVVSAPPGNANERSQLTMVVTNNQTTIENVLAAIHSYVSEKEVELRFGAAVETAFGQVRGVVDAQIADLAPEAATKLSSAFENATSENAEDWANAAATCRRLIKAVADALRPPGPDVNGRKMGNDQFINRLVDWIVTSQQAGGTATDVIVGDLQYLGKRLDAFADAGHKGAHAEVTRYEASRFITGTYLLIGDILQLRPEKVSEAPALVTEDVEVGKGAP